MQVAARRRGQLFQQRGVPEEPPWCADGGPGIGGELNVTSNERTGISDSLCQELLVANEFVLLGIISRGIAHDLTNLLGIALGRVELAMQMGCPPQVSRQLEVAKIATLDAAEAVKRLGQQERDQQDTSAPLVDLATLAREVAEICEPHRAQIAEVTARDVELTPIPGDRCLVKGNRSELRIAVTNIVMNGLDALEHRGGRVTITTGMEGGRGNIAIRDTGPGIPADLQDRIFDAFFTTKGDRGMGLGLSLAREAVARLGGSIQLTSAPGQGSVFTISLPVGSE